LRVFLGPALPSPLAWGSAGPKKTRNLCAQRKDRDAWWRFPFRDQRPQGANPLMRFEIWERCAFRYERGVFAIGVNSLSPLAWWRSPLMRFEIWERCAFRYERGVFAIGVNSLSPLAWWRSPLMRFEIWERCAFRYERGALTIGVNSLSPLAWGSWA